MHGHTNSKDARAVSSYQAYILEISLARMTEPEEMVDATFLLIHPLPSARVPTSSPMVMPSPNEYSQALTELEDSGGPCLGDRPTSYAHLTVIDPVGARSIGACGHRPERASLHRKEITS